jgi:hypothetical protein
MSRRAAGVRVVASAAVSVALMCASGVAQAQFTPTGAAERQERADPEMQVRTLRSGIVIEIMLGYGISTSAGYPNNANQIGDPAFYSASDVMFGSGAGVFVGGALADYLNFGFFAAGRSFKSSSWKSSSSGFGIRVEAFPLVYAIPKLKDLGTFAEFGIGSSTLDVVAPGYPEAKGVQSFIGIGAFYEWKIFRLFGGHAVAGPMIEYDQVYSQAISSGMGILGARIAFYGGP